MELPTFREETCKRKVAYYRSMVAHAATLSGPQQARLVEEMRAFRDSLSMITAAVGGGVLGLGAAVLPVIGLLSGPVIGGIAGAYQARRLARYRSEVEGLILELEAA